MPDAGYEVARATVQSVATDDDGCQEATVWMNDDSDQEITVEVPPDVQLGEGEGAWVSLERNKKHGSSKGARHSHSNWKVRSGSKGPSKGSTVKYYTIPDIENDVALPLHIDAYLVGKVTGFKVTGPDLDGDTFDLKVNGDVVETVTGNDGWTVITSTPIVKDDTICPVVNTVSAGTGAALCYVRIQ